MTLSFNREPFFTSRETRTFYFHSLTISHFIENLEEPVTEEALKRLRILIKHKPDTLNQIGLDKRLPLITAVQKKEIQIVETLINTAKEERIVLNVNKGDGTHTPLTAAISLNAVEIVKFLMQAGAALHIPNEEGDTPFLLALQNGNAKIARILLNREVDENRVNSDTIDAVFQQLLEKYRTPTRKSIPESKNNQFNTQYSFESFATFESFFTLQGSNPVLQILAEYAIKSCHLNLFKLLVEKCHVPLTFLDENNKEISLIKTSKKPCYCEDNTSFCQERVSIRALIKVLRSKNVVFALEENSYHLKFTIENAIIENDLLTLQRLLKQNKELDLNYDENSEIEAPVISATIKGSLAMLKTLIAAGARVNVFNHQGESPLSIAIQSHNIGLTQFLMNYSIPVHQANKCFSDLLGLAILTSHGSIEIVQMLLEAATHLEAIASQCNKEKGLIAAIDEHDADIVSLLIKHKVNLKAYNEKGDTPLLTAVDDCTEIITRKLLEAGATVNVENAQGETPLSKAILYKDQAMVQLLLSYQADPNWKNAQGVSALNVVQRIADEKVRNEIIKQLNHLVRTAEKIPCRFVNSNPVIRH